MKTAIKLIFCFLLFAPSAINGQVVDTLQPYVPYWFIEELLEWSPEKDQDAIFNRSNTPLASKIYNESFKANNHARANEAKVEMLPVFAPTNGNPAQGSLNKNYYAFTYWQYCDLMVYWGGSSYEGIILTPTAGVIDAAHRHGVPVYGTVFFPPIVYGGKREWVYQFIQNENGVFPVADKLIEVAKYYGFDGWFINQETGNKGEVDADTKLAKGMQQFMTYYKNKSDLSIQWYDAMLNDGTVRWQHEINEKNEMFFQHGDTKVADQMFLDFRYNSDNLSKTKAKVEGLGRDIYDVYGGIDVQSDGYETKTGYTYPQGANFNVLFPEGKPHSASMAFYVPSWTFSSADNTADFYKRESRFWVGEKGDPRNTKTNHNWKGVAHYIPAKSSINTIPFVSNFCTGHGDKFFLNGKDITSEMWNAGWNNLSLQDIQPTWRWIVESKGEKLNLDYDFTDAFNGGNCIKISGVSKNDNIIPLYGTQLKLNKLSVATIAVKKDDLAKVSLLISFTNGTEEEIAIGGNKKTNDEWLVENLSLQKFKGRELNRIAIKIEASEHDVNVKIGSLGIMNKKAPKIQAPKNVQLISKAIADEGCINLRMKWEGCNTAPYYYRLYKIEDNGSKTFVGATTAHAYFLSLIPKKENEKIMIAVESVGNDISVSPLSILSID